MCGNRAKPTKRGQFGGLHLLGRRFVPPSMTTTPTNVAQPSCSTYRGDNEYEPSAGERPKKTTLEKLPHVFSNGTRTLDGNFTATLISAAGGLVVTQQQQQ